MPGQIQSGKVTVQNFVSVGVRGRLLKAVAGKVENEQFFRTSNFQKHLKKYVQERDWIRIQVFFPLYESHIFIK